MDFNQIKKDFNEKVVPAVKQNTVLVKKFATEKAIPAAKDAYTSLQAYVQGYKNSKIVFFPTAFFDISVAIEDLLRETSIRKFQLPTCDVSFGYTANNRQYAKRFDRGIGNNLEINFGCLNNILYLKSFKIKGIERVFYDDENRPLQTDPLTGEEITKIVDAIKAITPVDEPEIEAENTPEA